MKAWFLVVTLTIGLECSTSTSNSTRKRTVMPLPWLENLVKLDPPHSNRTHSVFKFKSFSNKTIEDEIITDEDVADIPDDESHTRANTIVKEGDKTTIHVSEQAGEELYQHWLDQAVSGLMATVATNKLDLLTKQDKIAHRKCARTAKTVLAHAKCVSALLEVAKANQKAAIVQKPANKKPKSTSSKSATPTTSRSNSREKAGVRIKMTLKSYSDDAKRTKGSYEKHLPGLRRLSSSSRPLKRRKYELPQRKFSGTGPKRIDFKRTLTEKRTGSWEEHFRRFKRSVEGFRPITRDSYTLTDVKPKTPFSAMAQQLTAAVRAFKNKDRKLKNWQETLEEIAQEAKLLKKKEKVKKMLKKRMQIFTKVMHDVGVDSPVALDMFDDDDDLELSSHEELEKEAKEAEEHFTDEDRALREPIKLIRQGVKLAMMLKGEDVSDFDNKTLKMVSPRIMPLTPDELDKDNKTVNLFSPNLFSMHNSSSKHDILNLAKMISGLGGKQGTQEWMNFVFEAAGVSDAVGYMKAERVKADQEEAMKHFRNENGTQQYFNKENITAIYGKEGRREIDHIEQLHTMFSQDQFDRLNSTGYVSMTKEQLEFLYGEDSPYHNKETLHRLMNVSEHEQQEAIESTIHSLAKEELKFKVQRRKDIVLSPVLFGSFVNNPAGASQALVLSPILFTSVITSPSVFGSVILSPWAFVPVILSPRALGAVVLSPILFAPVVLSPLAMVPIILSAGVGLPFILSPFILSPFILTPVVLTPVILSPFALSPFIMVPNVMSPLILSPFVLSPLILSPPAITAFILTPYALSPIIKSDGFAFTAVLSPSWLS